MKKIITILLVVLLCACQDTETKKDETEYENTLEILKNQEEFLTTSKYFDLEYEVAIDEDNNYRFYLFLDSVQIAMYDVKMMAIDKTINYNDTMAANVGIFDTTEYNLIPNQVNADLGFYSGIMISGTVEEAETELYILVEWKNKELSQTTKQFIKLDIKYTEDED